ncbi:glutaminyl-peptide cyclotransferase [Actinocrispum sp. NPDC049592]|uniref:glutaminyl-peptide cyclotransferase n=1 Tax=Actinocrispum sp. NPDC049592 TaxID=3154835 RepID=UPI003414CE90
MLLTLCACVLLAACTGSDTPSAPPANLRAEVLATLPHDTSAFTEGLEFDGTTLYEGTGLEGQSQIRITDVSTGAVTKKADLPDPMFGEGITIVGDKLWQLTYKDGVAIQRDKNTLAELKRATYTGEGWGLCHDGKRLVMSNGTDELTFRDPDTFAQVGSVQVRSGGKSVVDVNELECTPQGVYANIWKTDRIVRIDPQSGEVTATVTLTGLLTEQERANTDVLNGIAAVPGTDQFLVTGKNWPKSFRVRFVTAQ